MMMKLDLSMLPTLTVTREQTFNIDIAKLADIYEEDMCYSLYEKILQEMDLGSDIANYVDGNSELAKTILDLVKMEMFKRLSKDAMTKF